MRLANQEDAMTALPWGQWRGTMSGPTNAGHLVVNIDRDRPLQARVSADDRVGSFIALARVRAFTGDHFDLDLTEFVPYGPQPSGTVLPQSGKVDAAVDATSHISGSWKTDVGTAGELSLDPVEPQVPRSLPATQELSWNDFVKWAIEKIDEPGWLFRGQDTATKAISSTFHRAYRRDLVRYDVEEIGKLRRALEAVLGVSFLRERPDDYGTLLNLAQHHGFPTPLIDFTASPFIAAYFALSTASRRKCAATVPARVFAFRPVRDSVVQSILAIPPVVAPLALGARMNPRVVPQQSINVFSNVPDVENFIALKERASGAPLSERIDIPAAEAARALRHLRSFGISALSMFPGVEGACRGLAEACFPEPETPGA